MLASLLAMLSASVASQIVFISTLKQTAGGWVLIGVKGRNEDDTNSLYSTSWYGRLRLFRRGEMLQGFISFGHHPHTIDSHWLTDCSQRRTSRRGRSRETCALFTAHWGSPALSSFDDTEKTAHTAGTVYNKIFYWFWNRDFSKPRYTLKPVIVPCLFSNSRQVHSGSEIAVIVNVMCSPVAESARLQFSGMMKYVRNCCLDLHLSP